MQKMKWFVLASLACSAGFLGGCASVSVHPVSVADANNPAVSGIRFYQSTPYLLVTEMPTPMRAMMQRNGPGMPSGGPGMAMRGPNQRGGPMGNNHWGHGNDHAEPQHSNGHRMMPERHGPPGGPGMVWRRPMPPMPGPMARPQRVMLLQIIYLPDFSRPYVANFNNPFSRGKNSIVLANGWELMGINVKGRIQPPPPVRALMASPMPPPHPMHPMMMGAMGMQHGRMGQMRGMMPGHPLPSSMRCKGRYAPTIMRKKMLRPGMRFNRWHGMMMRRRAAMAMGLKPGLYQFVYSPKTGQLLGLRAVRILPEIGACGAGMMCPRMCIPGGHWKKHLMEPMGPRRTLKPAPHG